MYGRIFFLAVPSSQSPVPSPQSPVPSPQSPVPSPQSPVPSPQSPQSPVPRVPSPQSPKMMYKFYPSLGYRFAKLSYIERVQRC
ncbi:hypothetical protein FJR11_06545 [Anabaena sp. UHCC 0187]|nr:hypothetical protein [Anabaena sp. UHCC 0187]